MSRNPPWVRDSRRPTPSAPPRPAVSDAHPRPVSDALVSDAPCLTPRLRAMGRVRRPRHAGSRRPTGPPQRRPTPPRPPAAAHDRPTARSPGARRTAPSAAAPPRPRGRQTPAPHPHPSTPSIEWRGMVGSAPRILRSRGNPGIAVRDAEHPATPPRESTAPFPPLGAPLASLRVLGGLARPRSEKVVAPRGARGVVAVMPLAPGRKAPHPPGCRLQRRFPPKAEIGCRGLGAAPQGSTPGDRAIRPP